MDKKKLKQYKALQKEIPLLSKKLDKLYDRRLDIPEVVGKVEASSKEFPYIEGHVSVKMYEPEESERISKQIRINEARLKAAEADKLEIEEFIAGIPDSTDRQIFELVFIDGMKQYEVGDEVGYSRGRISQIIDSYLKD